jgi:Flp pilus assembly protein TadG
MARPPTNRRQRKSGVEMIEFTLTFLPFIAFLLLLIDLGWSIYGRATLQFAVREGCRFAITNQVLNLTNGSGQAYGMVDSVKTVVQERAMGFLGSKTTDPGYSLIQVRFYDPSSSLTTALAYPTSSSSPQINVGGNLVEVSVENYKYISLGPILRSAAPLYFTARSSDRMEANPPTGVPNLLTGTGY